MHLIQNKIFYSLLKNWIFFILILSTGICNAQISPGKLSKSHSHLEGVGNCTQCHNLGEKISEQKCLDCHKILNARISSNKGYHSSVAVKTKDCISCHSEHHGLKFEAVRIDKNTFDHKLTGYELIGGHKGIDCRKCHSPDHIADLNIRKLPTTYLGLDPKCITCHEVYHQKNMSQNCASCHDFGSWKSANKFNHQKTGFPLLGAHQKLDCKNCHKTETVAGKQLPIYKGLDYKNCGSCHQDPHRNAYGQNCKVCHSEDNFKQIRKGDGFNHSLVGYNLEGKHKTINCNQCHDQRHQPSRKFYEFKNLEKISCQECHKDPHDGRFGLDCKQCHHQESFTVKKMDKDFNHDVTGFPLENKHQNLECRLCHKSGKMTDPILHELCKNCHVDYHKGEFGIKATDPDCKKCHSTKGFSESSYLISDHNLGKFPLKGAHEATPCFACHLKENNQWKFKNMGQRCVDCHLDIHDGFLDKSFYHNQACENCHSEESWNKVQFDHQKTAFKLEGKHLVINCRSCHFGKDLEPIKNQIFKNLTKECSACHQEPHGGQFGEKVDCLNCHHNESWDSKKFSHEKTKFPLEGKHLAVSCGQCHETILKDNVSFVLYKNGKLACIDCHR